MASETEGQPPIPDPFARVRGLGERSASHGRAVGIAAALIVHGLLSAHAWAAARDALAAPAPSPPAELEIAVDVEPARSPPPNGDRSAPQAPEEAAPVARPTTPPPADAPPRPPASDPYDGASAPAKAPEVLTARGAGEEASTIASGDGTGATHGAVAGAGTGAAPIEDPRARVSAAPPPAPAPPPPIAPAAPPPVADQSRAPALVGGNAWRCPFPPEADAEQLDEAVATIVVTVGVDGSATAVSVTGDPGHGFGRAARACAFSRRYTPGLDGAGTPKVAATGPIRVRFTR